ncbi:putative surface protein with fasciclin (FAS1) repeats [Dokdonia sp. Hel_I_63]|uniref:fasciclin domain-containing protein n=1 Tax=Dokdonia sp. Hel_I_63 TaxID=1249996 RepID=UPI001199B093|nr:fasciclin domain-containing protein [Dokdonia sp. Hel_I_63]TVZ23060.1 putative surface protein with fasciclin (FAS1) repeats [Dokdonia sp. Hel_I_63]
MFLNKTILLVGCISAFVTLSSCDNKQRDQQIREEAEREIVQKKLSEKALKEQIIIEDNKVHGIVSKINNTEELSEFELQIKELDLDECLVNQGFLTIFAPNNKAFNNENLGVLDKKSSDYDKSEAKKALKYHVVKNKWTAEKLESEIIKSGGSLELTTQNGGSIRATIDKTNIILNDESGHTARILSADMSPSNGSLYIIDSVLMAD